MVEKKARKKYEGMEKGCKVTAKLQEPGWGHIQGGEDDFRQSTRGETALS